MIIFIIINILLIIFVYMKYVSIPKSRLNDYQELKELDSALVGYIDNKWGNAMDWTIAEVLELNRKGYITIEHVDDDEAKIHGYVIKKLKEHINNLKPYEANVYRILFEKNDIITIRELEEKLKYNQEIEHIVDVKSMSIRNEVEDEAVSLDLVNKTTEKIINFLKRTYPIIAIIALILLKEKNILLTTAFFIESVITIYILSNTTALTEKGKKIKSKIENYKIYLTENKLLQGTKIVDYILVEKDYINSIALHIDSEAKMEFIVDELVENSRQKKLGQIGDLIFIIAYIILFLSYILISIMS